MMSEGDNAGESAVISEATAATTADSARNGSETDSPAPPDASEEAPPDPTPAPGWFTPGRAVGVALLSALLGLLFACRALAVATLPHILAPGDTVDFAEAQDGLPVPRLLDWSQAHLAWMIDLRHLDGAGLFVFRLLLWGGAGLLLARILNPTFRLLWAERIPLTPPPAPSPAIPASAADENALPESLESPHFPPEQERASDAPEPSRETPLTERTLPRGPRALEQAVTGIRFDLRCLLKALLLALLIGAPMLLLKQLLARAGLAFPLPYEATGDTPAPRFAAMLATAGWHAALGSLFWLAFARDGLAGDFRRQEWGGWSREAPGLLLRGAVFGLGAFALLRWAAPKNLDSVLTAYQTLGTFHRETWSEVARAFLPGFAGLWFVFGALAILLGQPASARRDGLLLLLILCVGTVGILAQRPLARAQMQARLDLTPEVMRAIPYPWSPRIPTGGVPDGPEAGEALARASGVPFASPQEQESQEAARSVLVFHPRAVFNTRQSRLSEDGIPLDPADAPKIEAFLERRSYRTALSWVAVKHLFNVGAAQFDQTTAIRWCLLDLMRCPHLTQCGQTLREMLFVSSAAPENVALLDTLADARQFATPDRESQRMIGDLYIHFGAAEKALDWYRRAEMPRSFMARIRSQKPMFHAGRITGKITLNGKPLAGAQVGVVPKRLNGLPTDMAPRVLGAEREIRGARRFQRGQPSGYPRPFAFRWVSAGTQTGGDGTFTLNHLVEGEYYLLVSLPADIALSPPFDPALEAGNPPGPISLNYQTPQADLGTITLAYRR